MKNGNSYKVKFGLLTNEISLIILSDVDREVNQKSPVYIFFKIIQKRKIPFEWLMLHNRQAMAFGKYLFFRRQFFGGTGSMQRFCRGRELLKIFAGARDRAYVSAAIITPTRQTKRRRKEVYYEKEIVKKGIMFSVMCNNGSRIIYRLWKK